MTPTELNTLAHQIAYSATRSDIECFTPAQRGAGGGAIDKPWYDLSAPVGDLFARECIATAIFYLDARGLLLRDAAAPYLVRVLDVADAGQPLMLEPLPA